MTRLRVVVSRALDLLLRRRRDERLSEEIRAHLDLLSDQFAAGGMPRDEARLAARRAFGGIDQVKAVYQDQRGLPALDAFAQDVRFAGRLLRRDPGFAITAVVVLAIGIGVNNMLFTILNAHTLRGLPVDRPDRIVSISTIDDRARDRPASYLDFLDWESGVRSFETMAAYSSAPVVVAGGTAVPDRFDATFVSADAFRLIGAAPALGRGFTRDDHRPGAAAVVLLGAAAWERRYGADPGVLGTTILVNNAPASIVGIMPDRSGFPSTAEIWLPLEQLPGLTTQARDSRSLSVIGRLHDRTGIEDARSELTAIAARLSRDHPGTNQNVRVRAVPINERLLGRPTEPAWMAFMATGVLVVLISCANVANLLLARSTHRAREIAIRAALGASRRRVVRQLLIEGTVLAALGAAAGLLVAVAGVRLFSSAMPQNALPYWFDYSLNVRVVSALVGVSALTVFVFALLPAVQASKTDVTAVLKDGGHRGGGPRGVRWSTAFLAAEFALAVVLLAHVATNVRTAVPTPPAEAAIESRQVLSAAITLPPDAYGSVDRRSTFYQTLTARLEAVPGVAGVGLTSALPLMGAEERRLDLMGKPHAESKDQPTVWTVAVSPGYFTTLGVPLERGRDFVDNGGASANAEAIVNQRFVERFLVGADPVGQRISLSSIRDPKATSVTLTIAGVVASVRQRPTPEADPVVYVPFPGASPATATIVVRVAGDLEAFVPMLRAEVARVDPGLPLYRVRTIAQVVWESGWVGRVSSRLLLTLTVVAVSLSTVGLFAVTMHGVNQRRREIGMRVALGARRRDIVRLVLRRMALQLAIGFGAGVICTKVWEWTLAPVQPGITSTDPRSLLSVAAVLLVLGLVASIVPMRRAMAVDPGTAVRHD